jgi:hypothetical protein
MLLVVCVVEAVPSKNSYLNKHTACSVKACMHLLTQPKGKEGVIQM